MRRMNRPQVVYFLSGVLAYFPSGARIESGTTRGASDGYERSEIAGLRSREADGRRGRETMHTDPIQTALMAITVRLKPDTTYAERKASAAREGGRTRPTSARGDSRVPDGVRRSV